MDPSKVDMNTSVSAEVGKRLSAAHSLFARTVRQRTVYTLKRLLFSLPDGCEGRRETSYAVPASQQNLFTPIGQSLSFQPKGAENFC